MKSRGGGGWRKSKDGEGGMEGKGGSMYTACRGLHIERRIKL